jgi:hypothetical protein
MADMADVALVLAGAVSSMLTGVVTAIVAHTLERRKERRARRQAALEERLNLYRAALGRYEEMFEDPGFEVASEAGIAVGRALEVFGMEFSDRAFSAAFPRRSDDVPAVRALREECMRRMRAVISETETELGIPPKRDIVPPPGFED